MRRPTAHEVQVALFALAAFSMALADHMTLAGLLVAIGQAANAAVAKMSPGPTDSKPVQ